MTHSFFIFGATGYIGGAVLLGLKRKYGPETHIAAFVRNENDFPALEAIGVKSVHGSSSDRDLVSKQLSENHYDAVIYCANDDMSLAHTILEALKKRKEMTGKESVYLHTSGAGIGRPSRKVLTNFRENLLWLSPQDSNPEDVKGLDPTKPHRNIDIVVFDAAKRGDVKAYIVAPTTIYGTAHENPGRKVSVQIPNITRYALSEKQVVRIGDGSNRWNNVHYRDLVELFLLVLNHALTSSAYPADPYEAFYFGSVGEHIWGEVFTGVAQILYNHPKKLLTTPEVRTVELNDFPKLKIVSSNSRSVGQRSFGLGWKPKEKPLSAYLEEDVLTIVDEYLASGGK